MVAQFQILNKILQDGDYSIIKNNNLTEDYFYTYKAEFNFIKDHVAKYGKVPDIRTFKTIFEDFKIEQVTEPTNFLLDEIDKEYNLAVLVSQYNTMKEKLEAGDVAAALKVRSEFDSKIKTTTNISCIDITKDFSRFDRYQERANGDTTNYYLTTGLTELDQMTGGIDLLNELMVIVARTGVGKSWFLLKMAASAYAKGKNVGIYSGEMVEDKVGYRIDTILGHISNKGLNRGNPYIQSQYARFIEQMKNGTLGNDIENFVAGGSIKIITPELIGDFATVDVLQSFIEKENLDVLFIDQFSLMKDTSNARQTNEKVANISTAIKRLQVITKKPIIAVSQMNRQGGKNEDGEEKEADSTQIGLSDKIGQDATTLIFLSKKQMDENGKPVSKPKPGAVYNKYLFTFTVGKARDGGEGKLEYAVDLDTFDYQYFIKDDKRDPEYNGDLESSDSDEYTDEF